VVDLVSAGGEPLEVDECIIAEIKTRAINGIVELSQEPLRTGDAVEIIDGPLRGVSGVCERYLSGPERVTLLIALIGATSVRVVAPTRIVARSRDDLRRVADGRR
jgi:transcription antitermination factor NusG